MEAVIWCPKCEIPYFRVLLVPTGSNGVFENTLEPINDAKDHKHCLCGKNLERRLEDNG